jgi:hypothetical protein
MIGLINVAGQPRPRFLEAPPVGALLLHFFVLLVLSAPARTLYPDTSFGLSPLAFGRKGSSTRSRYRITCPDFEFPRLECIRESETRSSCSVTRLGRLRHVARCPVAWRIDLNTDHKAVVREWLAMGNAAKRFETATDRSNRQLLIGLPTPPGHNSGAVTADVDGVGNFERGII